MASSSLWIDREFLNRVRSRLRNFKQKSQNLYNFSCPICGDSQKNLSKARGYCFVKGNILIFKCHNCNVSYSFDKLLEILDKDLHKEYKFAQFTECQPAANSTPTNAVKEIASEKPSFSAFPILKRIDSLPDEHSAKEYLLNRKISSEYFKDDIFFVDDMTKMSKAFPKEYGNTKFRKDEARIVFPFKDANNNIVGFSCRSLLPYQKPKYINLKLKSDTPLIFGINKVRREKMIPVVEGPIDSLFLNNAVAVSGADFLKIDSWLPKDKCIIVFDNQPKNPVILHLMEKVIEANFKIFIWPLSFNPLIVKDINDVIMNQNLNKNEMTEIIRENSYQGLSAKMKYIQWKRL